jgi:hypothetical protein
MSTTEPWIIPVCPSCGLHGTHDDHSECVREGKPIARVPVKVARVERAGTVREVVDALRAGELLADAVLNGETAAALRALARDVRDAHARLGERGTG